VKPAENNKKPSELTLLELWTEVRKDMYDGYVNPQRQEFMAELDKRLGVESKIK
jgi:hypothetical protein